MSNGMLVNVAAFCSWPEKEGTIHEGKEVEERSQEELIQLYEGWEPEVQQLVQCMEKPSVWTINSLKELSVFTFGNVVLTGDAVSWPRSF